MHSTLYMSSGLYAHVNVTPLKVKSMQRYPLLYSKTVVFRGVHYFCLILLLVNEYPRSVLLTRLLRVSTIYVLSKYKTIITMFHLKNYHFYRRYKLQYIAWACNRND